MLGTWNLDCTFLICSFTNLVDRFWKFCLGLRKGPSCFNQQGQVVAMESSHYTSKVGMSSWVPQRVLGHRGIFRAGGIKPCPDHIDTASFPRPWLQTNSCASQACQQIESDISRREGYVCHLSPSNRSTGWPGPARLKIYSPCTVHDVQCYAGHKEQSPAPGWCLEHRLVI